MQLKQAKKDLSEELQILEAGLFSVSVLCW